jgi:predicted 3-demethylubiquinone-9 3-methyltransferase (glyoxalase superfamily)
MQKITPCLWFDNQAEEAVNFYVSIFKNSQIGNMTRYGDAGAEVSGRPKGSVMTITFEIEGQEFVALNGGPHFSFSEATSLMVKCETQKEIDEIWEKLSHGGEEGPCGWLKDKYGARQGCQEIRKSHEGHPSNDQARSQDTQAGI